MDPFVIPAIVLAIAVVALLVVLSSGKKRSDGPGPDGTSGGGNSRPGTGKH